MDISVTITRAAIFFVVYSIVLGIPLILAALFKDWFIRHLGANWWMGPFSSVCILGAAGPFVYVYLERKAASILLKEQRRYQEILKHVAVDLTRIRNLQKLLDFIVETVAKTIRISHSSLYLSDSKTEEFILKASVNQKDKQPQIIEKNNALIAWLYSHKESLVYEEVKRRSEDDPNSIFNSLEKEMKIYVQSSEALDAMPMGVTPNTPLFQKTSPI